MTPTYYPQEQLVRGFGYGHGDDMALYTFRWKDGQLDSLEYIEPPFENALDTPHIVRSYWVEGERLVTLLDSVPAVYRTIEDAYWIGY